LAVRRSRAPAPFFWRDHRLFLITSRHVLSDAPSGHLLDGSRIGLHTEALDLTRVQGITLPLYAQCLSLWRRGGDSGGPIAVAALQIDRAQLPVNAQIEPFGPEHLQVVLADVRLGTPLLMIGCPLGCHDTRHHLPVARQAIVASAFGVRFQGEGAFLTDARTHRGKRGAPVILSQEGAGAGAALLGVHGSSMDMSNRDQRLDDSLGLNLAWYADIMLTLTA
jgi:hypothetical protein